MLPLLPADREISRPDFSSPVGVFYWLKANFSFLPYKTKRRCEKIKWEMIEMMNCVIAGIAFVFGIVVGVVVAYVHLMDNAGRKD